MVNPNVPPVVVCSHAIVQEMVVDSSRVQCAGTTSIGTATQGDQHFLFFEEKVIFQNWKMKQWKI